MLGLRLHVDFPHASTFLHFRGRHWSCCRSHQVFPPARLASAFVSVCAAVDMSSGSPKTEDMVIIDSAAAVEGGVAAAEGGSTAVECGSAAVDGDIANMEDGIAAVVGGSAAESMAEAEGMQHIPQFAATAYAPGSFRPCGHMPCALYCMALIWKPSF